MLGITKESQLKYNRSKEIDLKDDSIIVRLSKKDLKARVNFVLDKICCQVCEVGTDLDYPHHSLFGSAKKDG